MTAAKGEVCTASVTPTGGGGVPTPHPGSPSGFGPHVHELAFTGAVWLVPAAVVAVLLLIAGIALLRRRSQARDPRSDLHRRGLVRAGVALSVGFLLISTSLTAGTAVAHADTVQAVAATDCDFLTVTNLRETSGATDPDAVLPGQTATRITAEVTNAAPFAADIYAKSAVIENRGLAKFLTWTARGADSATHPAALTDTEPRLLGTVPANSTTDLLITVQIPAAVGNAAQATGVQYQFSVVGAQRN